MMVGNRFEGQPYVDLSRYWPKAIDIAGYTFNADNYCPRCIAIMWFAETLASLNNLESALAIEAARRGIDYDDERSYDSSEFPKVIFNGQVESDDERCGRCGESL